MSFRSDFINYVCNDLKGMNVFADDDSNFEFECICDELGEKISNFDPADDLYIWLRDKFLKVFQSDSILQNNIVANILIAVKLLSHFNSDTLDSPVDAIISDFALFSFNLDQKVMESSGKRCNLFLHESSDLNDSFAYFDFRDIENTTLFFDKTLAAMQVNIEDNKNLGLMLVLKVIKSNFSFFNKGAVFINVSKDLVKFKELLKLVLVLNGKVIYENKEINSRYDFSNFSKTINHSKDFSQYAEAIYILSEYNSRGTIVDAYLAIYHVIENYMLRARIAEVVRNSHSTGFFGIRDFKRLAIATDERELTHLKTLIDESWDLVVDGKSIDLLVASILNSCRGFSNLELAAYLKKLTVIKPNDNTDYKRWENFKRIFHKVIYQTRCSIVHNKETEYHISNKELESLSLARIIDQLLIPAIATIAFSLPLIQNSPTDYSRKSIDLYS